MPGDGIENEEFGLGAEVGDVADAGGLEIGLGAAADGARVAVIALAVGRLDDVAGQHQGGFVEEGVHEGGIRVGLEQHVGSLDALPAGDGRTVEGMAVLEPLLGDDAGGNGHVLFLALGVGKAQVNELGFVVLDHFQNVGDRHGSALLRINRNHPTDERRPTPCRNRATLRMPARHCATRHGLALPPARARIWCNPFLPCTIMAHTLPEGRIDSLSL